MVRHDETPSINQNELCITIIKKVIGGVLKVRLLQMTMKFFLL